VLLAPVLFAAFVCRGAAVTSAQNSPAQGPDLKLKVSFYGDRAENRWTLRELGDGLQGDWASSKFLVLEIKHKWAQPYQIRLDTDAGLRAVTVHPFGDNVLTRISVPLRMFSDLNPQVLLQNACRIEPTGPIGPFKTVQLFGIAVDHPQNDLSFEIRSLRLSAEDKGSEILESLPVVNEFGQWTAEKNTSYIRNAKELQRDWDGEVRRLGPKDRDLDQFGGNAKVSLAPGKFFRVEKVDGRSWLVDPTGHPLFATGFRFGNVKKETEALSRSKYFAETPIKDTRSFYEEIVSRRWSSNYSALDARWGQLMDAWGLSVASPEVGQRAGRNFTLTLFRADDSMPDVWSDQFIKDADRQAVEGVGAYRDSPQVIGFFSLCRACVDACFGQDDGQHSNRAGFRDEGFVADGAVRKRHAVAPGRVVSGDGGAVFADAVGCVPA